MKTGLENDTLSIDYLRRPLPPLGDYRYFPTPVADHTVRAALRRLLGKGISAFSQLAAPTPLFRPYGS